MQERSRWDEHAQPVGPDSGNGQSPFFLAFLVNLTGVIGISAVVNVILGLVSSGVTVL